MEHKTYRRYTKPVEHEYELKFKMHSIRKIAEITGKVTNFEVLQFSTGNNLRIDMGRNHYYFLYDDVAKRIKKDLEKNTHLTIQYVVDKDREWHITSCINHTQNYTIINQYYQSVLEYKEKTEKAYQKAYSILYPYRGEDMLWFVLSRSDKEGYKYKLEKIEKASDYHKSYNDPSAISLLGRKYFGDNYREVLYSYSYYSQGCIIDEPEYDKVYAYSHTTSYKQRDCSWCKNEAYDNYSLRMGGYVSDYYCAHCFFEENHIEIPEDFVAENIDKENKGYEVE